MRWNKGTNLGIQREAQRVRRVGYDAPMSRSTASILTHTKSIDPILTADKHAQIAMAVAPYPDADRVSSSLGAYLPAFQGHEAEPFITYHGVSPAPGQVRLYLCVCLAVWVASARHCEST